MAALWLVTGPAAAALTVDAVKKQCHNEGIADDDDYIEDVIIPAVTERAEIATWRQLIRATYALKLRAFPECGFIDIPKPPLYSVSSVAYVDTNGTAQTLTVTTDYVVDAPTGPRCARGRIEPAYGKTFPSTRDQMNAVTVTFVAGYGTDSTSVPGLLTMAMLRDAASLFAHREDVITGTITAELPRSSALVYRSFKSYPRP